MHVNGNYVDKYLDATSRFVKSGNYTDKRAYIEIKGQVGDTIQRNDANTKISIEGNPNTSYYKLDKGINEAYINSDSNPIWIKTLPWNDNSNNPMFIYNAQPIHGYNIIYYNQNNQPVGSINNISSYLGSDINLSNVLNNHPNLPHGYTVDRGQMNKIQLLQNTPKTIPVYVLGNKANLNIQFKDGNKVIDSDEFNGTNAIGDKITQIDSPKGYHIANQNNLPNGYSLDDGSLDYEYEPQNIHSSDIQNNQTVEQMKQTPIQVTGNSANVYVKYISSDGNLINGDYVSGTIGQQVTLDKISDYNAQYSEDNKADLKYTFTPNNINYNNNNTEEMNDYIVYVHNIKQSDTSLRLIYINQNGKQVGFSDIINGTPGQRINDITNSDDGGEPIPSGYVLNSQLRQSTSYILQNNPATVYLRLRGQSVRPYVNINRIIENNNGSVKLESDRIQLPDNYINGNEIILNANNYLPNNNYSVDNSEPAYQTVTINNHETTPENVTFYYKQNSQPKAQPITVRYINQVGRVVKVMPLSGIYNQNKVNGISDGTIIKNNVPNGYLDNVPIRNYNFTNQPQNVDVNVMGNYISYQLMVHQIIQSNSGNGKYQTEDKPVNISGRVGSRVAINPYNINGQNIIPQYNGQRCHAIKGNDILIETLSNDPANRINNITYLYQEDAIPTSIGMIKVHYVTSDKSNLGNPSAININDTNYYEVDEESDQGLLGNSFNINPYLDDIPNNINSYNYDLASNIDNKNEENVIDGKAIRLFNSNEQDVYIHVKPDNNLIILNDL